MATFRALNVDSDHESEDEVDDTKEIQIEEALKLYQTALKLHSEGPASFERAAEAYRALFESEIFKYPESFSEYKRHELYGDTLVFDTILEDDFDAGPVQPAGANESAPNTLQQILHLSYKNHGQFMLETMQHWIREHGDDAVRDHQGSQHILDAVTYFAEALDKEDTDLDLWLRTASVAALLGSQRITRFCLEAVLDGDDELIGSILRLPGLEEGFAGQQLRELVSKLEDSVSLMQPPLSSMSRKTLSATLKKRLNPYPFAPLPSDVAKTVTLGAVKKPAEHCLLNPVKWDWAGIGEAILHHFHVEQGGFVNPPPGSAIAISVPDNANVTEADEPNAMRLLEDTTAGAPDKQSPQPQQDGPPAAVAEAEAAPVDYDQDVVMEDQDKSSKVKNEDAEAGEASGSQDPAPSQSRKRSTDSAGLPETAEGGRSRSKRIRARDIVPEGNIGAEPAGPDLAKLLEDKLYPYTHADKCLFEIINDILERLGVEGMGSPQELRDLVTSPQAGDSTCNDIEKAACDLYVALQSGASKVAGVLLSSEPVDLVGMSREAGLNAFLGYAKTNLSQTCVKPILGSECLLRFVSETNKQWLSVKEVAFAWLEVLLSPGSLPCPSGSAQGSKSSYMQYRWAEDLKRHLVQVIVNFDDFIYERLVDRMATIDAAILKARVHFKDYKLSEWDIAQFEMAEIIFELHLDVYSLIKHPHSGVDSNTQTSQRDRLERWSILARDGMQLRTDCNPDQALDQLALRHIWASVFHMSVNDDIPPEHVVYAMEELKTIFQSNGSPVIEVQNNAVMPELSIAAVDRELARISMKGFFLKVFDQDDKDPVAVIESLEPILEPVLEPVEDGHEEKEPKDSNNDEEEHPDSDSSSTLPHLVGPSTDSPISRSSPFQEMRTYLETASVSVRVSLWQRLREAYEAIEYHPKVVSCYLRSIETLVGEFKTASYSEDPAPARHVKVLSRLRIIDDVLVKTLQIIKNEKTAFDCLTYEHLQSTIATLSGLLRIMSAGNMLEDMVRVGQLPPPRFEGCHHATFNTITTRLHDMQLRTWMLQYYLLKEGISQTPAAFPTPSEEHFEFLRHVHYATGVRQFCHATGRLFLRLAKDELLRLDDVIDGNTRDTELAQVLHDLYGLKAFVQPMECHEFHSVPEVLDKKTAFQLLPFILSQARKINIKDLPKTDLKITIDKVHGSLGRPKMNEDISMNRKILTTYFRSPISPVSLFNCLKGVGSLSTKYIPADVAVAASQGWYFLMGNIALSKFRSQKRLTQGPTEDLNFAQAFYLQDLEYSAERWETWYRLAQVNDLQLEECVAWTADKLNSNSMELLSFQRVAVNCYIMATACALRDADVAPQTIAKVSDMYSDFGNRVYSSSREPFNMNVFNLRDNENRFYSGFVTQQVYQNVPFKPLNTYTAWKFASVLFKRAIQGKPDKWWNHYMLAKCLWKMYCSNADAAALAAQGGQVHPPVGPNREEVVAAVVNAINTLPEKRERGREPILEPHYKLVSITHKLFQRKAIDHIEGEQILRNTPYAQNVGGPDNAEDWERYIIGLLKALRTADKSAWHHRMIARTAHVIYDDSRDTMVAHAAKHELTQQMFTKTMTVQVWRPENERPGRHFVYTSRYTRFFTQLLDQTGDKANMELLAKRVRRKQNDFFEHLKLWHEVCSQYLRLLRRLGRIPENHEDTVFKATNHDEFTIVSSRLEAWSQDPSTQNPILDVLRDVIELKRLNNSLMKVPPIDDLIGDTYALLFATVGPKLPPLPSEQPQQPYAQPFSTASTSQQGPGPLQVDGALDLRSNPSLPFNVYRPNPMPTQAPETTSRSRPKTIGKREIQRRAEAVSIKPAAPAPAPTSMVIRSPPLSHPQLLISNGPSLDKTTTTESSPTKGNEQLQIPPSGIATAATSAANSAPGSVQDDADDESELSELDESEVREIQEEAEVRDPLQPHSSTSKPLFPNLSANREKGRTASSAASEENGNATTEES